MSRYFRIFASLLSLLTVLAVPVLVSEQPALAETQPNHRHHYRVIDLGTLGGSFSQAFGVNNEGWVVGFSATAGDTSLHAFLWRKAVMTDLGTLGGADTLPYSLSQSVNDAGKIVGFSESSFSDPFGENFCGDSLICKPVVWRHQAIHSLPTLGGTNGQANDVNQFGLVGGVAETDEPDPTCTAPSVFHFEPVLWMHDRAIRLPTIGGDPDGFVGAVNDKDEAVGTTIDCSFMVGHSVLWRHGKAFDITHSRTTGDLELSAGDVNNRTQVTGTAFDPSGSLVLAYIWQNDRAKIIGALPNHVESHGNAINNKSEIVGQSCSLNGFPDCSVFLWRNGVMKDLNDLVAGSSPTMVDSGKNNDRGQVVGLAITREGEFHAFLASPSDDGDDEAEVSAAVAKRSTPVVAVPEVVRTALERRMILSSPFGHRRAETISAH